jgi:hypothetical protein
MSAINTNYLAINADTDNADNNKTAPFKFSDHMGAKKIIDKKTGKERGITIRDVAESTMLKEQGIDKVHGWSVQERK